MKHPVNNKKPDKKVQRVLEVLEAYRSDHPKARINAYRLNPACIRIRILDPDFARTDPSDRDTPIWRLLDQLPEDIGSEISFLVLLTPKEARESGLNLEFESPASYLLD